MIASWPLYGVQKAAMTLYNEIEEFNSFLHSTF